LRAAAHAAMISAGSGTEPFLPGCTNCACIRRAWVWAWDRGRVRVRVRGR
jgi:hypothetical protein